MSRRFDEPTDALLGASTSTPSPEIDSTRPNIARVYDWLLGGKENYLADGEFGEQLLQALPRARDFALANRYFMARAVRFLAGECGITQFIDMGSGLPTVSNVHEVAQSVNPTARVLYVDNDPIVLAHAHALLAGDQHVDVITADIRQPETAILRHPTTTALLDLSQPVALLFVSVLHFLSDDDDPAGQLHYLHDVVAPGSALVLSHIEQRPETEAAAALYQDAIGRGWPRSRDEIAGFFTGWDLVAPGVVPTPEWRPDFGAVPANLTDLPLLGGVARKAGVERQATFAVDG